MDNLALKVILTPGLIAAASFAGRRWGPGVSGWLVGLPFTSAPITLYLALDHGRAFAAVAAVGILAGTISQTAFCLAYGWLAVRMRRGWPVPVMVGCLTFTASTAVLQRLTLAVVPLVVVVIAALGVAQGLMPRGPSTVASSSPPSWDIPARMLLATAFVLLLTGVAPALGPHLSGLLAPFPLFATILAVFAHRLQGPAAAAGVLRGLLLGLFAFAGFFFVVATLIEPAGIALAFAGAAAVALALQGISLWILRYGMRGQAAWTID